MSKGLKSVRAEVRSYVQDMALKHDGRCIEGDVYWVGCRPYVSAEVVAKVERVSRMLVDDLNAILSIIGLPPTIIMDDHLTLPGSNAVSV